VGLVLLSNLAEQPLLEPLRFVAENHARKVQIRLGRVQ
jgi:hypothetical protein